MRSTRSDRTIAASALLRPTQARWAFIVCLLGSCLLGQPATIPEAEALYAPTPQRLAAVHAAAKRDGWLPQAGLLRAAATLAYDRDKLQAAEAWYHVYRWSRLLGQPEGEFVPQWVA